MWRGLACVLSAAAFAVAMRAGAAEQRKLRVCADGNNMPFSNERGEGFENRIAALVAKEMHAEVEYTWAPQRRGFVRTTLKAKRCDVIMGVPASLDMVATTVPYYRSGYVFVYGPKAPRVRSLNDEALHGLRIGVPLVGDDGANPPPVLALASLGLTDRIRGYSVYGDYSKESPPSELLRAVRAGEVDIAIAWGPLAGYFAAHEKPRLEVALIPSGDAPVGLTFAFDIAMGVRHADKELLAELNGILASKKKDVAAILHAFHVPRSP